MSVMYTIAGHILAPDGSPVPEIRVRVKQLADLATGPVSKGSMYTTESDGHFIISWTESSTPASPWDLFVEAQNASSTIIVESRLITDPPTSLVVDLIFGEGTYIGRSEWDRISGPIETVLDGFSPQNVPASRLEWVTRRANVFPTLTAMFLQAHRLSAGRTVKAQTCYACLRHGLPPDLPGLLRAGRAAWEDALRTGWEERIIPLPGDGSSEAQDDEVADELAALDELVVDNALYDEATGVNRRKILDTAEIEENDQQTFTELWLAHDGTLARVLG